MKHFRFPAAVTKFRRRIRPHITRKRVMLASGLMLVVLMVIPVATYAYFSRDINDRERLMNRNSTGFVLLDKNGETIYSFGRTSHENDATLAEISDFAEKAAIASEDAEFYKHDGFSLRGIASAFRTNVLSQDATRQGGSTITQQLVKNNLLSSQKSFLRKYQEISMAIAIERHYSKQDILEMYLNSVYFGEGAFGIEQAAQTYFDKPAADLTLAESSMLVGLLPAPSAYSPISGNIDKAEAQQARVLKRMVSNGDITQAEMDAIAGQPLAYNQTTESDQKHAQHFISMVMSELNKTYGEEKILRSGFEVKTSLDLDWQWQAEAAVKKRVGEITAQGATNAGMVAIDPKTGEIRVLVGSADWDNPDYGKVNMAVTPRQPGSSFKPIFYTEALDRRIITAATVLKDEPTTFGGTYTPLNYDKKFRGDITVRSALAQSLNIPAVEVMQKLGPRQASQAAQRLGISDVNEPDKYGLSLGLGTAETKLLDMTNAYASFANKGDQFTPTIITSITNKYDREVFKSKPAPKQVMSPEASFLISSILSDNNARAPMFGTRLNIRGRQVAVKTGTTNDNRDAWTIGYTPSLAIGVWVGDNANRPMTNIAGSSGAGPIWSQTMTSFLGNSKAESFEPTSNIIKARVCGGAEEYFIKGTESMVACPEKSKPKEEAKPPEEDKKEEKQEQQQDNKPDEGGRGASAPTDPTQPPSDSTMENPNPSSTDSGTGSATSTSGSG